MGKVIWLTGLSGSGKTTLGTRITEDLCQEYRRVEFLDGNRVRDFFEDSLGYSRKERIRQLKRITFAAALLAKQDVHVVVASIAGYYEIRDFIRRKLGDSYIQIYIEASLKCVMRRDVHGHYAAFDSGNASSLIGLDEPYQEPRNPHLTVRTDQGTVSQSLSLIRKFLFNIGILNAKNPRRTLDAVRKRLEPAPLRGLHEIS